jgi:hypothetical protein
MSGKMKTFREFLSDYYLGEEKLRRPLSPKTYSRVLDKADTLDAWRKGASGIMFKSRNRDEVSRLDKLTQKLKARSRALRSAAYNNQPSS